MKSSLKIIGVVVLLVITGVVKLINEHLEKDLKEKFEAFPNVEATAVVEPKFTTKQTTQVIKPNLNFYSNEYISFYYPQKWDLTQNKQVTGFSINIHTNDNSEQIGILSIVILDNQLSTSEALTSVLKGFLKSFEKYKVHNSTKTTFKGNISDYKKIEVTKFGMVFNGEAFAFEKNGKVFTLIKLSDSENGLSEYFTEIENSFEFLTYQKKKKEQLNTNITEQEKLAEGGDKTSQAFLGYAYLTGDGATKNYDRAFYWNKKLAESGYGGAMYLLGYQYKEGLGTKKDVTKGDYWMKEAKKNGFESNQVTPRQNNTKPSTIVPTTKSSETEKSVLLQNTRIYFPRIDGMIEALSDAEIKELADMTTPSGASTLAYYMKKTDYNNYKEHYQGFNEYFTVVLTDYFRNTTAKNKQMIELASGLEDNYISKNWNTLQAKLSDLLQGISIGQPVLIDSYSVNKNSRTLVLLIKYMDGEDEYVLVTHTNLLLIKGKLLFINHHYRYTGNESITKSKAKNDYVIHKFFDANKNN
jgi:TPR repeat protein